MIDGTSMSVYYDFDEVDAFTVGAVGQPGPADVLPPGAPRRERVTVKCEKQQAAAIADYLRKVLQRPAAGRRAARCRQRSSWPSPIDAAFVLGPIGLGYDRADRPRAWCSSRRSCRSTTRASPTREAVDDRGRVRVFLTRGQARGVLRARRRSSSPPAARRACGAACPIDPDGHVCPRMN